MRRRTMEVQIRVHRRFLEEVLHMHLPRALPVIVEHLLSLVAHHMMATHHLRVLLEVPLHSLVVHRLIMVITVVLQVARRFRACHTKDMLHRIPPLLLPSQVVPVVMLLLQDPPEVLVLPQVLLRPWVFPVLM